MPGGGPEAAADEDDQVEHGRIKRQDMWPGLATP
jgi:hypothetical protein